MKKMLIIIVGQLYANEEDYDKVFSKNKKHIINKLIKKYRHAKIKKDDFNLYFFAEKISKIKYISTKNGISHLLEYFHIDSPELITNESDALYKLVTLEIKKELKNNNVVIASYGMSDFKSSDNKKTVNLNNNLKELYKFCKSKNIELVVMGSNNMEETGKTYYIPFITTNKKVKDKILDNQSLNDNLDKISKTKKSKINILVIINILILLAISIFYMVRLIHFYKLENKPHEASKNFYEIVLNNTKVQGNLKDNIFEASSNNNFIKYGGYLFRIISLNQNGTMKLITDDNITSLVWDSKNISFSESYLNSWLNDTFLNTINKELLVGDEATLLTNQEYDQIKGKDSYLNINKRWWLIEEDEQNKPSYIGRDGVIVPSNIEEDPYVIYGVRPVITLKQDIKLLKGDGTKENPYILEKNSSTVVKEKYVGEYVKLNNNTFKILKHTEKSTSLVMDGFIKDIEGKDKLVSYDTKSNVFKNSSIYKELLIFEQELNPKLLVKDTFNIGYLGTDKIDYEAIKKQTFSSTIGLLEANDLFLNEYTNYFLLNGSDSIENNIYIVNDQHRITREVITTKRKIRPVIKIKNDLNILSGSGEKNDPYILEGEI